MIKIKNLIVTYLLNSVPNIMNQFNKANQFWMILVIGQISKMMNVTTMWMVIHI